MPTRSGQDWVARAGAVSAAPDELAADLDASSARGYVRRVEAAASAFAILIPNTDRGEPLALAADDERIAANRPRVEAEASRPLRLR